jgi:phage/plasmid-like protein (TIGR03299 family)
MAHDLNFVDGKASMFYAGEKPWHGLGTELAEPATAAEAIAAAGLDFDVALEPIVSTGGLAVPMGRAVVRSDTNQLLGLVGSSWRPIQNRDCFAFLDGVVADEGLRYHTAGALGKGERVWMLAKLPGHIRVNGTDDVTEKFLLLSNAHDGRSSLRCYFTAVRVVCANTLTQAERGGQGQGVTIRHTGNLQNKVREAQRVLGLANHFYEEFGEKIQKLAEYHPTPAQVKAYFQAIYPAPEDAEKSKRATETAKETWNALEDLFENGRGQDIPGVRHTAWSAFNSVTEFVDHVKPQRNSKLSLEQAAENRLSSIWFGEGAKVKAHAFEEAMAMVSR